MTIKEMIEDWHTWLSDYLRFVSFSITGHVSRRYRRRGKPYSVGLFKDAEGIK